MTTTPTDDTATSWMADGNCRNYPPAVFFPSDGVGVDRARRICATCAVTADCLEYALEQHIDHGVWGGCSERERRRILKRRRIAVSS
jgi:WhiB family transcriptional regulator, redox-sensing transcriptional regulator